MKLSHSLSFLESSKKVQKKLELVRQLNIALCISIGFIILIATLVACKKTQNTSKLIEADPEVSEFINSKVMNRISSNLASFGELNYSETKKKKLNIQNSSSATLLIIPIILKGKTVGSIEAVKIPKGKMPNNDDFAINLVDLRSFNTKNLNGVVKMIDVNYDFFEHTTLNIENNKVKSFTSNGLPNQLKIKYNKLAFKQRIKAKTVPAAGIENNEVAPIYGLCDSDSNHNISFSECYKCATDAVSANGFSSFVCDFPVLGWLSCWGSISATCVVVSSNY